jgi:hypothetical protein
VWREEEESEKEKKNDFARSFSCNARSKTLKACRESNRSSGSLRIKDTSALPSTLANPYFKKINKLNQHFHLSSSFEGLGDY